MVQIQWTEDCPGALSELEYAEELGAKWEDDELVTYDYPGFVQLLEYYESDEYLNDNDDPLDGGRPHGGNRPGRWVRSFG